VIVAYALPLAASRVVAALQEAVRCRYLTAPALSMYTR